MNPSRDSFRAKRVAEFDRQPIARQHQQIPIADVDLQWFAGGESLLDQQPEARSGSKPNQLSARIVAISKLRLNP